MSSSLSIEPRISEKSYGLSEKGTYIFTVPLNANKHSVKRAVEAQYGVSVTAVRTVIQTGKPKRIIRKRQQPKQGLRVDMKKAYVTLKTGEKIDVFPEAE